GQSQPWVAFDHTANLMGATPVLKGGAFPYVRSDHKNAIVYIGTNSHIHEIVSNFPTLVDTDLYATGNSDETVAPSSEIWGYKRFDGVNAIVFVGTDGNLHELSLNIGVPCAHLHTPWCDGTPTASQPTSGISQRPSGYVRADNGNAVVYLSNNGNV